MDYARGCDVSHHIPVKDWDAMIASGIEFLGIKASQGAGFRDPTLAMHRDGRRARSDLVGAIFYHYPDGGQPEIEAANFLGAIGELRGDERLALDVEQGPTGHGAPTIDWQKRFIAALPTRRLIAPGIDTDGRLIPHGIYTAAHVWNEIGDPPWPDATAGNVFLWIKRYAPDFGPCPSPWSYPILWQTSATGSVPGVGSPVDLDCFVGTSADCRTFFKGA